MKLYEINQEIENFFINNVDEETGEILNFEQLEQLQISKDEKIENIALAYKNALAEADAIKQEKLKLAERQKQAENQVENIKNYLKYALNGNTFKTAKVNISYRKSEIVKIDQNIVLAKEYLTYKDPEPNKTAIKNAIKQGVSIQGVEIETKQNIQIK